MKTSEQNPEQAPPQAGKGLSTKHIVLILGSVAIVCAAIVAIVLLTRPKPIEPSTSGYVVDEGNFDHIQGEIKEKVANGMFETYMNTTWTFPDGKSASSNAVFGNGTSNNYPLWFEVALKDTNEVVFTSSTLPVGTAIKEIVLTQDLAKGSYPAVVKVHMVDDNGEPVDSNVGFNITIVVKS